MPGAALGVGIIGLSATRGWAASAHVPALRAVPGLDLRAVSASTPESTHRAARQHGIAAACGGAAELAARPDVDLVVVAVRVPRHAELVAHALAAGKAVLCEWPLARDASEAAAMADAAAAAGVPAFAGLQARAAPALRHVRELVCTGALGEIVSTTIVASGGQWGATADASTEYLVDAANGATLLTVPVGHAIDAVCHCLGEFCDVSATLATRRPRVRNTTTGREVTMTAADQVVISGRLAGGAVACVHYRGGRSRGLNLHWEINGTEGDLVVTGKSGHLQYGMVDVWHAAGAARELRRLQTPPGHRRLATDPGAYSSTVLEAYAGIVADLRDGTNVTPTFADAVTRHELLDAVARAAESGERQAVAVPVR